MTANVRKRRRKIDPDHSKKKAIKKAGKTALTVGSSVMGGSVAAMGEVAEGAKSIKKTWDKKSLKDHYGDWLGDKKPVKAIEGRKSGRAGEGKGPIKAIEGRKAKRPDEKMPEWRKRSKATRKYGKKLG